MVYAKDFRGLWPEADSQALAEQNTGRRVSPEPKKARKSRTIGVNEVEHGKI
jgi:hypothetical protein